MLLFLLIALAAAYVFYTYWQYAKFPPGAFIYKNNSPRAEFVTVLYFL
jgi:hypothetical protein